MSDDKKPHHPNDQDPNAPHHLGGKSRKTAEHGRFDDESMLFVHTQLMREKEEPSEGFSPTPIFLIFLFGALMFWAGIYLITYSGSFRSDVYDPNWKPNAAAETVQVAFDPLKQGAKLYKRQCQQCHQADANGIPGVYPPISESNWVNSSEDRLIAILLHGLNGEITVNGSKFNGNMPAVGMWKDRDIAAVLTYIRANYGNDSPEVSEEKVAEIRAKHAAKKSSWNGQELIKVYPF